MVAATAFVGSAVAAPAGYDGVAHREFTATVGGRPVIGDVVEVDLGKPRVRAELVTPGVVAARASVASMANDAGAVAAINGDFFDIGRSNAPAGPAVMDGQPLKAAVPQGRRAAPPVAGAEPDYAFTVGADGVARIDRLRLVGEVRGPAGTLPVGALNQHAVPVGGIGVFTAAWGEYDRGRTLCGTDEDRTAACAADQVEVLVRDGVVISATAPRAGTLKPGEVALLGREQGAQALRALQEGDAVEVDYALEPGSGVAPQLAIGGMPIVRDGQAIDNPIANRERAPRSAVGLSADGRKVFLVTVDGRQSDSAGTTLPEFATLLAGMGIDDAVNLDGGGSSTLVFRPPGASRVTVVNDPSDSSPRLIGNGVGVFVG
ncbi:MAG: phosphodiester glycosidase family protein [Pseudonocardia sp.]